MAETKIKNDEIDFKESVASNNISIQIGNENIYEWKGYMIGKIGSHYEGGTFNFNINYPEDYPLKPPKVQFTTKIFHPNIEENGNIKIGILESEWNPTFTIKKVLLEIENLLYNPDLNNIINQEAGNLYKENIDKYKQQANVMCYQYANGIVIDFNIPGYTIGGLDIKTLISLQYNTAIFSKKNEEYILYFRLIEDTEGLKQTTLKCNKNDKLIDIINKVYELNPLLKETFNIFTYNGILLEEQNLISFYNIQNKSTIIICSNQKTPNESTQNEPQKFNIIIANDKNQNKNEKVQLINELNNNLNKQNLPINITRNDFDYKDEIQINPLVNNNINNNNNNCNTNNFNWGQYPFVKTFSSPINYNNTPQINKNFNINNSMNNNRNQYLVVDKNMLNYNNNFLNNENQQNMFCQNNYNGFNQNYNIGNQFNQFNQNQTNMVNNNVNNYNFYQNKMDNMVNPLNSSYNQNPMNYNFMQK